MVCYLTFFFFFFFFFFFDFDFEKKYEWYYISSSGLWPTSTATSTSPVTTLDSRNFRIRASHFTVFTRIKYEPALWGGHVWIPSVIVVDESTAASLRGWPSFGNQAYGTKYNDCMVPCECSHATQYGWTRACRPSLMLAVSKLRDEYAHKPSVRKEYGPFVNRPGVWFLGVSTDSLVQVPWRIIHVVVAE